MAYSDFFSKTEEKQNRILEKKQELGFDRPLTADALAGLQKVDISPYSQDNADGDNLTTYNPKTKENGIRIGTALKNTSVGVWETKKDDSWYTGKNGQQHIDQMNRQAIQLDFARGVEFGTSSWEDVYLMGEYAKQQKNKILNYNDGVVDPNNPDAPIKNNDVAYTRDLGLKDKSGGERSIRETFNQQGQNVGLAQNAPLTNPAYYGRFNKGFRDLKKQSERTQKNKAREKQFFTDSQIKESYVAANVNRAAKFIQGANEVGGITAGAVLSSINTDTTDIKDKAKITYSNINAKRDKLIKEEYGSLAAFDKTKNKDKALKSINEKLRFKLNANELDLLSGKGEYATKEDKAAIGDKKEGVFSGFASSIGKERILKPVVDKAKSLQNIGADGKKKESKKGLEGFLQDVDRAVKASPLSVINSISKTVAAIVKNDIDVVKEKLSGEKATGFNPKEMGKIYSELKSQEDLDKTVVAVQHGLNIGLKELINNSNTERVTKKLEKQNVNLNFELIKYKQGKQGLGEFTGKAAGIIGNDLLIVGADPSAVLDTIADSGAEMIAISVSGGAYAAPLYMNSLNLGKIAYKKNHNNRDIKGNDLLKLHAVTAAATALRVGAGEFALGSVAKGLGRETIGGFRKATPLGQGLTKILHKQGLLVKDGKNGFRLSAKEGSVSGQNAIFQAKRKELNTLISGSEKSLVKHEGSLVKQQNILDSMKSGGASAKAITKQEKNVAKLEGLATTNKVGLASLKNQLKTNTKAITDLKALKSVDDTVKSKQSLIGKQNLIKQDIARAKQLIKDTTPDKAFKGQGSAGNIGKLRDARSKLKGLLAEEKNISKELSKLDNIKLDSNIGKGVLGASSKSSIKIFGTKELKMTLGKKGFQEASALAKALDTSPGRLVTAISKASAGLAAAGAVEYGEEFGEEIFNQLRDSIGTDKELDFNKARVGGALGFGAGAGIRSVGEVRQNGGNIVGSGVGTIIDATKIGLKATGFTAKVVGKALGATGRAIDRAIGRNLFPNTTNKIGRTVDAVKDVSSKVSDVAGSVKDTVVEKGAQAADAVKNADIKGKVNSGIDSIKNVGSSKTSTPAPDIIKKDGSNTPVNTSGSFSSLNIEGNDKPVSIEDYDSVDSDTKKVLLNGSLLDISDSNKDKKTAAIVNLGEMSKQNNIDASLNSGDPQLMIEHALTLDANSQIALKEGLISAKYAAKVDDRIDSLHNKAKEVIDGTTNSTTPNPEPVKPDSTTQPAPDPVVTPTPDPAPATTPDPVVTPDPVTETPKRVESSEFGTQDFKGKVQTLEQSRPDENLTDPAEIEKNAADNIDYLVEISSEIDKILASSDTPPNEIVDIITNTYSALSKNFLKLDPNSPQAQKAIDMSVNYNAAKEFIISNNLADPSSFEDKTAEDTVGLLLSLNNKDAKAKRKLEKSIDKIVKAKPNNTLVKAGKALVESARKGLTDNAVTNGFKNTLNMLTGFGGKATNIKEDNLYTALQGVQSVIHNNNKEEVKIVGDVISSMVKDNNDSLKEVSDFLTKGDVNAAFEFEGKSYKIGGEVETLRDSLETESNVLGNLENYYTEATKTTTTTTEGKASYENGRTEATEEFPLNSKSKLSNANLLTERGKLESINKKDDSTLEELFAINDELAARGATSRPEFDNLTTKEGQLQEAISEDYLSKDEAVEANKAMFLLSKDPNDTKAQQKIDELRTKAEANGYFSDVKLKEASTTDTINIPKSIENEVDTSTLGRANKLIIQGFNKVSKALSFRNPNIRNVDNYTENDIVNVYAHKGDTFTDKEVEYSITEAKKAIAAGARFTNIHKIENNRLSSAMNNLLTDSGYRYNSKLKLFEPAPDRFKGTLAQDTKGKSANADVIKAEIKHFNDSDIKTVDEAVDWAIATSPDIQTTALLQAAKTKLSKLGITMELLPRANSIKSSDGSIASPKGRVQAKVNSKGEIKGFSLFLNSETGGYKTVAHEILHLATLADLLDPKHPEKKAQIKSLMEEIKASGKVANLKDVNGLKNEGEFLAELSNPKFRALLNSIVIKRKAKVTKGVIRTALDVVKSIFKDALGSIIGKDYTALDRGLELLDELLDNGLNEEASDLANSYSNISNKGNNKNVILKKTRKLNSQLNKHRTNYFQWGKDYLNNLAIDVFTNKFLSKKGKTIFTANTQNPIKNNIKPNKNKTQTVFTLLEKGLRDLKALSQVFDLTKSTVQNSVIDKKKFKSINLKQNVGYITDLIGHFNKFNKVLDTVLPDLSGLNAKELNKMMKEAPILGFYTARDGGMDQNIKDAMAMAGRLWLSYDHADMFENSEEYINEKFLGNSPYKTMPYRIKNKLVNSGILEADAIERIGSIFLDLLPITADSKQDPLLKEKIKQSAAIYILNTLQAQGKIEMNFIPSEDVNDYRDTPLEKDEDILVVRPVTEIDEETELERVLKNINLDALSDFSNRHLVAGLFGTQGNLVMPSTKPMTEGDIKRLNELPYTDISEQQQKSLLINGRVPHLLNKNMSKLINAMKESTLIKILVGDLTDKGHNFFIESKRGKHLGINNEVNNFKLWMKETERSGVNLLYDAPIYMYQRVWNNIRMGITNNVINFQASKFHRFMFGTKDSYYSFGIDTNNLSTNDTIDITTPDGTVTYPKAVIAMRNILEGFGISTHISESQEAFEHLMDEEGNINNDMFPDLSKAVDSIINLSNKDSNFNDEVVKSVIDQAGGKTHSLLALNNLAEYSKALKEGKPIERMMLVDELDGLTNGTSISLMQVPFHVEEAKNILRATGVFFKDDVWNTAEEFLADPANKDMYQKLTDTVHSILKPNSIKLLDSAGRVTMSMNIEGFAKLNNILMPNLLEDKVVTPQGRDFFKQFLMTYIYSKGDAARIRDMEETAISQIYRELSDISELNLQHIIQSEVNILEEDTTIEKAKADKKLKALNESLNEVRKDAVKNRASLIQHLKALIVESKRLENSHFRGESRNLRNEAYRAMNENKHLLRNGAYDYSNKTDHIVANYQDLIKFHEETKKQPIEDLFSLHMMGSIAKGNPLTEQYLPDDVEVLVSNLTGKVYGQAINDGLGNLLGDYQHSRSLINTGIRYAAQVAHMIFTSRADLAKRKKAIALGLDPDTDVPLTGKEVKTILRVMLKAGELHSVKHASSSKSEEEYLDSLLILADKKVAVEGSQGKVSVPVKKGLVRTNPLAKESDPQNREGKTFKTYKTITSKVNRFEFDPDTRVKASVNLTHAFDSGVQQRIMSHTKPNGSAKYQSVNIHDAIIVGSMQAVEAEQDYNQDYFNQNSEYSMYTEVANTVARAYKNYNNFVNKVGSDNRYVEDFNKAIFKGKNTLRVPKLHDTESDSYVGFTTTALDSKDVIELQDRFKNGFEVVSAVLTEADHINSNRTKLYKGIRHVNQFNNHGNSFAVSEADGKQVEAVNELNRKDFKEYKKELINTMSKEEIAISKKLEDEAKILNDFIFDDAQEDVHGIVDNQFISNISMDLYSENMPVDKLSSINSVTMTNETFKSVQKDLASIDTINKVHVTTQQRALTQSYLDKEGQILLKLANEINLKVDRKANAKAFGIDKGQILITSASPILNSNNPIGAKEALAHSMSFIVWKALIAKDSRVSNALHRTFSVVTSGKNPITYKDFLKEPEKDSSDLDIEAAKQFYDKVFKAKDIESFASFVSTNAMMQKAVSRFEIPEILVDKKSRDFSLANFLQRTFAKGVNNLSNKNSKGNGYVKELSSNLRTLNEKSVLDTTFFNEKSDQANDAFSEIINKNYDKFSETILRITDKYKKQLGKPNRKDNFFKFATHATAVIGLETISLLGRIKELPDLGNYLQEATASSHSVFKEIAHDLVTELRTAKTIERSYYKILRHSKYYTEAASNKAKHGFIKQYTNMFDVKHKPSLKDQEAFARTLIRTDMQSIAIVAQNHEGHLEKLLTDTEFREKAKQSLEDKLDGLSGNRLTYYKFHSKNLAKFMTTQSFDTFGLMRNAYHIASMRNITDKNVRDSFDTMSEDELDSAADTINKLVSIYALDYVSEADRTTTAKFLKSERSKEDGFSAMDFLMFTHRTLQEDRQDKERANHKRFQINKGYTHESMKHNVEVVVKFLDDTSFNEASKNYVLQDTYKMNNRKLGIYYNKSSTAQRYQTGIMSTIDDSLKDSNSIGMDKLIKSRKNYSNYRKLYHAKAMKETALLKKGIIPESNDSSLTIPNWNKYNGNSEKTVPYYSFVTPLQTTETIDAFNNNAGEIIGNTLGHNVTAIEAPKYNEKLADLVVSDYRQNYKSEPDDFIRVSFEEVDNNGVAFQKYGSHKQKESLKIMPSSMRRKLETSFGVDKPIFIRRATFNSAFGFRKVSLTNSPFLKDKKDNSLMKKIVYHSSQIVQSLVLKAKTNNIIYNPKTLVMNTVSNMFLLNTLGVPPEFIFKSSKEALIYATRYRAAVKTKASLQRKLAAFKEYKDRHIDVTKVKNLTKEITSNPIHEMVRDGLLQSVVEDVTTSVSPVVDSLDDAVRAFSPTGKGYIKNALDKVSVEGNKLSIAPVDVIKNVIITDDTDLASAMRDMTQYSDFIARYTLIKYRTQMEKVDRTKAVEEAIDTFIDYDMQTNPMIQYGNDMGLMQYTKFLFRIQKVLLREFEKKPATLLASEIAQAALVDVPTIADSSLAGGVYMPSATGIWDDATQLNLLKWLPFI